MKIKKYVIGKLDSVYAVSSIRINDEIYFIAATEKEGKCLIFSPNNWESSVVWDEPGGTMSITSLKGKDNILFAIQRFFPIFKAENATIVYAILDNRISMKWKVKHIIDMPFVHRIEAVKIGNYPYLIASTVCGGKNFKDDWSKPGAIYISRIPENLDGGWNFNRICGGLSKNHGMHLANINNKNIIYFSAKEGVFVLKIFTDNIKNWRIEQIIDREVSDIYVSDIDNDGKYEIITIEPFHGNELKIYKYFRNKWRPIYRKSINFGHVVWGGNILNKQSIIIGNRGGDKDLLLIQPNECNLKKMGYKVIDKNVGPTQILVEHKDNCEIILSANNHIGEIALYVLKH